MIDGLYHLPRPGQRDPHQLMKGHMRYAFPPQFNIEVIS